MLQDERSWWGFVNVVDICNRAAYELAGDTVIDGTTYRSVNRNWELAWPNAFDRPFALRADSTHARLYARTDGLFGVDTVEHLVMDLDLEVGALYAHPYLISNRPDGLFRVDSVAVIDGRKVLTLSEFDPSGFAFDYYGSYQNGMLVREPNVLRFKWYPDKGSRGPSLRPLPQSGQHQPDRRVDRQRTRACTALPNGRSAGSEFT